MYGTLKNKSPDRIERNTTAAEVARVLRRRILGGHYRGGEFLRQEAIAQELGVSRVPVREALSMLEAEGILLHEKYRGAVVPELSLAEIDEIYRLRALIEPYLLEAAIPNITPELIAQTHQLVDRSEKVTDVKEWAELNWDFHRMLYLPANLPLAIKVLESLLMRADRYLKMQQELSDETRRESVDRHRQILRLIERGDARGAIAALREHIDWNIHDIGHTIDRLRTA